MNDIEVDTVTKRFEDMMAVDGLSMTVESDDPKPFPGIELKADLIEQLTAAVAFCQVFYLEHGCWVLDIDAAFL